MKIDGAVAKIGLLVASIEEDEQKAEQEGIRTQESQASVRASLERQVSKSMASVGDQIRSQMAGIERVIDARDRQLDIAMMFLKRSLPEEFASHSEPFRRRKDVLSGSSFAIAHELDLRVANLNQALDQIQHLEIFLYMLNLLVYQFEYFYISYY